jgi:cytochrome c oxidase subunit IV
MIHGIRFAIGAVFCLLFVLVILGIEYAMERLGIGNIIKWAALATIAYCVGAMIVSVYIGIQEDRQKKGR